LSLLTHEDLREENQSVGVNGDSDPSLGKLLVQDVLQVIGTLTPILNYDPSGIGEIVSPDVFACLIGRHNLATEALAEVTSERIGMGEVAVFGHVRTVAARNGAELTVQPELGQTPLGSKSIDLGKNEALTLFESCVAAKNSGSALRHKKSEQNWKASN
jgi:hypothetical protein